MPLTAPERALAYLDAIIGQIFGRLGRRLGGHAITSRKYRERDPAPPGDEFP